MMKMTQVWERLFIGGHDDAQRLLHIPIPDATPISVGQFGEIMDTLAENIRWGTVRTVPI